MKIMHLAIISVFGFALVGCAKTDIFGGDVYSASQAKEARSISYGTIVSSRPVTIQSDDPSVIGTVGGGVLGGVVGSTIGGGSGRVATSAVGAIAGAIVGNAIEDSLSTVSALELVIRKDGGGDIVVVQKKDPKLVPGARVRIVGGSSVNVSAL